MLGTNACSGERAFERLANSPFNSFRHAMETSLVVKLVSAVLTVLALSAIAERAHPRISGVIAGMPLGSVFVYFFTGHERGADYIVASVPYGLASFSGTLLFVVVFIVVGRRWPSLGAYGSLGLALVAFFMFALVLVLIPFNLWTGAALTILAAIASDRLFRHVDFVRVAIPVHMHFKLMILRSALAAVFVTAAIAVASALNSRWAGIMVGFPMTMLPTIVILLRSYDTSVTHAFLRNFPFGMGSIIVFLVTVPFTFPPLGVSLGVAVSLALSLVYTAAAMWVSGRRAMRPG